jgi:hypothetical protein
MEVFIILIATACVTVAFTFPTMEMLIIWDPYTDVRKVPMHL